MHDFELKLAWAHRQFEIFEDQRRAWHTGGGYGVTYEPQPNSAEHIIRAQGRSHPGSSSRS